MTMEAANKAKAELAKKLAMEDFGLIVAAADAGDRCPLSIPWGPLRNASINWLVDKGMIRTELYRHNFRRVIILTGPHAEKMTAPPPDPKLKPWLTIDAKGRHKEGARWSTPRRPRIEQLPEEPHRQKWTREERPQPSKPRMLTREEISKL